MKKKKNVLWELLASVKLALFTFFVLAATSIIGTVIPQNETPQFYARQYSPTIARLFQMLDVSDMYSSWWFLALLFVFSLNLIVCTLERLPNVWRVVTQDNLAIDPTRLDKMANSRSMSGKAGATEATSGVESVMKAAGWHPKGVVKENGVLLFAQKGAWSRFGVYVVHSSILLIFLGAIIGSLFGHKASIYIPEQESVNFVYETGSGEVLPLGFEVRCDHFDISYYDNGAPKDYRSDLVVVDQGREVLAKSIEVNHPLDYKGFTFYQSSYQGYDEFFLTVKNENTGEQKIFRVTPRQQVVWQEAGIKLGIVNYEPPNRWGEYRLKLWFDDGKGPASLFWLNSGNTAAVQRPDTVYQLSSKQFFATGLQVAKDPGVWYVYSGCILMLLGLTIAFFMSHKRIWVFVAEEKGQVNLLVSGSSNKNKVGFENDFEKLIERLREDETLRLKAE